MDPDEQEARSRAHCADIVILLPLKSGNTAVFNHTRELCGIIGPVEVPECWHPPSPRSGSALLEFMRREGII